MELCIVEIYLIPVTEKIMIRVSNGKNLGPRVTKIYTILVPVERPNFVQLQINIR